MNCPNCGHELEQNAVFCPECGTRVRGKTCPHCGAPMVAQDDFCPRCGRLADDEQRTQRIPVQDVSGQQETIRQYQNIPQAPTPRQNNSTKMVLIFAVAVVIIVIVAAATFLKVNSQKNQAALEQLQQTSTVADDTQKQDAAQAVQKPEQQDAAEVKPEQQETVTSPEENDAEQTDQYAALREQYQAEINALWAEMDAVNDGRNQSELNQLSYENYQHWDALLNEIYQEIKAELSSSKFEELKASEKAWIAQRDAAADAAAADWAGGSGYALVYNGSLANSTGERCQWLVDNYLNN